MEMRARPPRARFSAPRGKSEGVRKNADGESDHALQSAEREANSAMPGVGVLPKLWRSDQAVHEFTPWRFLKGLLAGIIFSPGRIALGGAWDELRGDRVELGAVEDAEPVVEASRGSRSHVDEISPRQHQS